MGLNLDIQFQKIFTTHESVAMHTREEIIAQFLVTNPAESEQQLPGAWIGVPMRIGENVTGAFIYHPKDEHTYDSKEFIELLDAFSDEAAIALEWRSVNTKERALVEIAQELTTEPQRLDENEIIELVCKHASQLMDTSNIIVALIHEDTGKLQFKLVQKAGDRLDAEYAEQHMNNTPYISLIQALISTPEESKPFLLQTKKQVTTALQTLNKKSIDDGAIPTSLLAVPMRLAHRKLGTRVIGVICVYHPDKEDIYTTNDEEILDALSDQAAIAIENSRLYLSQDDQLIAKSKRLEDKNKRWQALLTFTQRISGRINLPEAEILRLIRDNARSFMDIDNMYIALYDELSNKICFPLLYKNGDLVKSDKPIERELNTEQRGKTEEIILTSRPLLHFTKEESVKWYKQDGHEEHIGDSLASWIGVPIAIGEKVLGVAATYHPTEDHKYSHDDLDILQAMADQAAIALENSRLYQMTKMQAQNLEAANRKIAENQDALTKSIIADDFVHRINNLAGTVPFWVNEVNTTLNTLTLEKTVYDDLFYCLEHIKNDNSDILRFTEKLKKPSSKLTVELSVLLKTIVRQVKVHYYDSENQVMLKSEISDNLCKIKAISSLLGNAIFSLISYSLDTLLKEFEKDKTPKILTFIATNYVDNNNQHLMAIKLVSDFPLKLDESLFIPYEHDHEANGSSIDPKYQLWRAKVVIEEHGGSINYQNHDTTILFKMLFPAISSLGEKNET